MDRYAVIGNPVHHSISPRIHAAFAEQTAQQLEYIRLLAPLDGFADVVKRFFAEGGRGANVTVPFKAQAANWVQELDPLAAAAGAVNTIKREGDRFLGFNTDGLGLVRDLCVNQGWTLHRRRILLVGAGGAASGVIAPLLGANPVELVIVNRTPERARQLIERFPEARQRGVLRASGFDQLHANFDIVINATSAGLAGEVPGLDPQTVEGALCYDMVYGSNTAFCAWAGQHGASAMVDGIGMLVEQAAEAFSIWRGIRPDTATILTQLRSERAPAP